jgi:hypothetical protein
MQWWWWWMNQYQMYRGWVDHKAGLDICRKFSPHQISMPRLSTLQQVAIPIAIPAHNLQVTVADSLPMLVAPTMVKWGVQYAGDRLYWHNQQQEMTSAEVSVLSLQTSLEIISQAIPYSLPTSSILISRVLSLASQVFSPNTPFSAAGSEDVILSDLMCLSVV